MVGFFYLTWMEGVTATQELVANSEQRKHNSAWPVLSGAAEDRHALDVRRDQGCFFHF